MDGRPSSHISWLALTPCCHDYQRDAQLYTENCFKVCCASSIFNLHKTKVASEVHISMICVDICLLNVHPTPIRSNTWRTCMCPSQVVWLVYYIGILCGPLIQQRLNLLSVPVLLQIRPRTPGAQPGLRLTRNRLSHQGQTSEHFFFISISRNPAMNWSCRA